jgi:hypothetical protein
MARNWASIDKMKYKKDSLAFAFAVLGLIANVVYFALLYKNNSNFFYSYMMGISVIYNLVFMLIVFLSAEEVKTYHRNYSFVLFVLAGIQFFRIFFYPRRALKAEVITGDAYLRMAICLAVSGVFLLFAAIKSFWSSTILKRYLEGKIKTSADEV